MKNTLIVCKNELIRYFTSPLAYVYLISFLILNGSFALYFGHFFDRGQASLVSMFSYQPWLYLLFIPGISMRLWAEEFRTKTIVQIMTMPVSTTSLVLGILFHSLNPYLSVLDYRKYFRQSGQCRHFHQLYRQFSYCRLYVIHFANHVSLNQKSGNGISFGGDCQLGFHALRFGIYLILFPTVCSGFNYRYDSFFQL